jgi:hypothetical protein
MISLLGLGKRTDEGYAIYKEDELGISAQGGGMYSHTFWCVDFDICLAQTRHCVRLTVIVVSRTSSFPFLSIEKPSGF